MTRFIFEQPLLHLNLSFLLLEQEADPGVANLEAFTKVLDRQYDPLSIHLDYAALEPSFEVHFCIRIGIIAVVYIYSELEIAHRLLELLFEFL